LPWIRHLINTLVLPLYDTQKRMSFLLGQCRWQGGWPSSHDAGFIWA
jgi:hypothetical protein